MDERQFSNIVSASLRMAENANVENLRESSAAVIRNIVKSNRGVFVVHGLRGTGKTTVLSEISKQTEKSLYLSGEVILKYGADLLEVFHHSEKAGYNTLLIDEIHAMPGWEKNVKIFYDESHGKIIASGSSATALKTKGSELSRRAELYEIKPLSFREYIYFRTGKRLPKITLEDILNKEKRTGLSKAVFPHTNLFDQYLRKDALPASFFENKQHAYMNIVERIVRYDLETLHEIDSEYIEAAFKIIKLTATSSPDKLSYSKIADSIERSVKFTKHAVSLLSSAGLFHIVTPKGIGHKAIRSEDKIHMPLSFRSALCSKYGVDPSIGGLREDFFIQHVPDTQYIKTGSSRRTPDYQVGNYIFEIGGSSKGWDQLKNMKNAYLVKESVTVEKNEIPLYLFGLLY